MRRQANVQSFSISVFRDRRLFRQSRHQARNIRDNLEQFSCLLPGKARNDYVVEKLAQLRPVAADIGEQDRLVVEPELLPAEDLEHLVEGADATGQNGECICSLRHQTFSLMHALDHHQFRRTGVRQLGVAQARWNDPDDFSAAGQSSIGEQTHQPDPPAAVNQPDPGRRQASPELGRRLPVLAVDRAGRAAIDA